MSPTLSTATPAMGSQSPEQTTRATGLPDAKMYADAANGDQCDSNRRASSSEFDRVALATVKVNERIQGRYRIGRMWQRMDSLGAPFWLVELVDRTATLPTYGFPDKVEIPAAMPDATLVDVDFMTHVVRGVRGKLHAIALAADPTGLDQVATLPEGLCAIPGAVDGLYAVLNAVKTPALQRFVGIVLSDAELCRQFLRVPASLHDHHSYRSGLVAHSVQGATFIESAHLISEIERELAIVGFLFHDIGKIRTLDSTSLARDTWRLIEHEDLTLEILAPALRQLDRDWPDGALALRHAWTCASPGASYGKKSASPIARLIRAADGMSQEIDLMARYLGPDTRYHRFKDGRQLWLPNVP